MAAPWLDVIVTDHAIRKWRERGAEYADAKCDDLLRAFWESRPLRRKDPGLLFGFLMLDGQFYRYHEMTQLVFCCTHNGCLYGEIAILTVKPQGRWVPESVLTWKRKTKEVRKTMPEPTVNACLKCGELFPLTETDCSRCQHEREAEEYRKAERMRKVKEVIRGK